MKGKHSGLFQFHIFLLLITIQACISGGSDTLYAGKSLSGNGTIISKGGVFEMGFFSPASNSKYYLGIWYKGLPMPQKTVVWVANREQPVSDLTSASLEFRDGGTLVLHATSGKIFWSVHLDFGRPLPNVTVGVLGDDGNFIIRESFNSSTILWRSFDYPTDTLLPGAYRFDSIVLASWKNPNDPSSGTSYAYVHISYGFAMIGISQDGTYTLSNRYTIATSFDPDHVILSVRPRYQDGLFRYVLDADGQLKLFGWWNGLQHWKLILLLSQHFPSPCSSCGEFTICNPNDTIPCHCIRGFVPINQHDWDSGNYECVLKISRYCFNRTKDKFFIIPNASYPSEPQLSGANNSDQCRLACLEDCRCVAYAYEYDLCFTWQELFSYIPELSSELKLGGDFYVRVAASEIEGSGNKSHAWNWWPILMSLAGIGVVVMLIIMWTKLHGCGGSLETMGGSLMHFNYRDLKKATRNFTQELGEGGFSTVYRGEFPNSTLVAVKQLKGQMHEEKQLRAEVSTIGIIQHRNLIRLRGFCLEKSKRYLVYDYMPNGSLEFRLFKKSNEILNWAKRLTIALGTARGLAYLHDSCIECIIHCDVKPENILLDADFEPKVADFGLAKLLGRNFSRVLTTMRGTRGYLAPEWFSGEAITPKVDVYSYGQVLFEIISGRRNMDMPNDELSDYFPMLVLNALNNGVELMTLADPKLEGEVNKEELTRACKVACWCIQDHEQDRPTMAQVIQILEGVLQVDVPPIPQFFRSLAKGSAKTSRVETSEAYSTSNSSPYSFSFQPPVNPIHSVIP
ncbi:G-type lectin S-receptor-like serine/threonine-protein kinase At2g19130 [Neltuma alba]|uniref:G-type lectin S-receptor-like serine/threonine-protein kinase At2g19130 n=1 Tax=Neltuma alba TaxID=207710 RepID=UPI0010A3EE17|nr:G-type lectin S-receptor-like serine/threonine-protein kinase At2g19130 [Prosopis alba]